MEINPYEAPRSVDPALIRTVNPLDGLRGPSIGLLLLSAFSAFSGTIAALNLLAVAVTFLLFGAEGRKMKSVDQLAMVALLISGVSSVSVFRGALSMRSGKSYRRALLAAILATLPILSPYLFSAFPFGIWALIVLRRKDVRAAFES